MNVNSENKAVSDILCGHLRQMARRLRQMPPDKWDWTFAPPAPTPRILAAHAWQWLICDRQHIEEVDARKHPPIPEPPAEPAAMCDALDAETDRWERMLLSMMPAEMDAPRSQFNDFPMTVRGFVFHMTQNCIYKNGQLGTLYFALGLDGDAPYDAPFPNPIYKELHEAEADETP